MVLKLLQVLVAARTQFSQPAIDLAELNQAMAESLRIVNICAGSSLLTRAIAAAAAQPDTDAAAILVDEFDAGHLYGLPHHDQGRRPRLIDPGPRAGGR
jgi:hypothetical protein